jgi:hypothetical protein
MNGDIYTRPQKCRDQLHRLGPDYNLDFAVTSPIHWYLSSLNNSMTGCGALSPTFPPWRATKPLTAELVRYSGQPWINVSNCAGERRRLYGFWCCTYTFGAEMTTYGIAAFGVAVLVLFEHIFALDYLQVCLGEAVVVREGA